MLLQSPETQGIKYKKETITTFRIPSTYFCPKSFQNPTDDAALLSQMVAYLICDELGYGFKSAYEQSQTSNKRCC